MPILVSDKSKKSLNLTISVEELGGLVYHSLFDYPLHLNELNTWSISSNQTEKHPVLKSKKKVRSILSKLLIKNKYIFFLDDRVYIKRKIKKSISKKKFEAAIEAAEVLEKIPSIQFVGVTGSLAMQNTGQEADIDLLITTNKNTLWSTRILTYLLLKASDIDIRKKEGESSDKMCLNIWLDDTSLKWDQKNIYTAHEIVQIIPLIDKSSVFKKLLNANKWAKDFWPNKYSEAIKTTPMIKSTHRNSFINKVILLLLEFTNKFFFVMQKMHMRKSITKEKVYYSKAIFHPVDMSGHIVKSFKERLKFLSN